jgi:hypothetical protein
MDIDFEALTQARWERNAYRESDDQNLEIEKINLLQVQPSGVCSAHSLRILSALLKIYSLSS